MPFVYTWIQLLEIHNFFTRDEADKLVEKALKDTSDTHGLHRSTTGATNGQVYSKRTSENAWDVNGDVAKRIKRYAALAIDSSVSLLEYYFD
jgi:hypothetical protein